MIQSVANNQYCVCTFSQLFLVQSWCLSTHCIISSTIDMYYFYYWLSDGLIPLRLPLSQRNCDHFFRCCLRKLEQLSRYRSIVSFFPVACQLRRMWVALCPLGVVSLVVQPWKHLRQDRARHAHGLGFGTVPWQLMVIMSVGAFSYSPALYISYFWDVAAEFRWNRILYQYN